MNDDGEIIDERENLVSVSQPTNTPEGLLALAIERGLQVDSIERLMGMAKEVRAERAKAAFIDALAAFQASCPVIQKTRSVLNKDGKGERYKYASMEDIKTVIAPLLEKEGLSFSFDTDVGDGLMKVTCKVQHQNGHAEVSNFCVPLGNSQFMSAQQNFASTLTYAKRYALCNSLGLVVGDEDNDGAAPAPQPTPSSATSSATSTPSGPLPPCPKCKSTSAVIVGKEEYGGGYICFTKKNGCGHKWHAAPAQAGPNAADKKVAMDMLEPAAKNGMKTLEKVWKSLEGKYRKAAEHELQRLKGIAEEADMEASV